MNRRPLDTRVFTDEEIARRRDEVIRRMGNTPPKPHSEIKLGKLKAKAEPKGEKRGRPKEN